MENSYLNGLVSFDHANYLTGIYFWTKSDQQNIFLQKNRGLKCNDLPSGNEGQFNSQRAARPFLGGFNLTKFAHI